MNKNILLLLLALALGFGAWFSWKKANRKSTLEKLDLNFAVSDTASIDRILIEPVHGKKAEMVRLEAGGWLINGKFRVAPVLMDVLLTTIRNLEMLRPLGNAEAKTAIEGMEKRGRLITVFVGGERYKSYRLGDDAPGNKGTYIQLEDGDPYVAHLRGFNGFLNPRFDADEYEWRDRLLIDLRPDEIKSVKVAYKRAQSEGFLLEVDDRQIRLDGAGRFDTAAAGAVLSSFKKIYAETFLPKFPVKKADSLLNAGSEWSLELNCRNPEFSKKIEFFYTSDPDRTLAFVNPGKEWMTIQNRVLYQLMQRKSGFINQ